MEGQDLKIIFSKIIVRAWSDPQFKQKLLKDPKNALNEEGIDLSNGIQMIIHENTDKEFHFVLPQKPVGELSDQQLAEISGGKTPHEDLIDWLSSEGTMLKLRKRLK